MADGTFSPFIIITVNPANVAATPKLGSLSDLQFNATDLTNAVGATTPAPGINTAGLSAPSPITPGATNFGLEQLLNARVKPNVLNTLLNPAYHFRLFLTQDTDLFVMAKNPSNIKAVFTALDSGTIPIVVIAETGVTSYNIRDVEIEAIIGPNDRTRNVNYTEMSITIGESTGVGFLEALKLAAENLKINNFMKCIYFLEMNFLGYNEPSGAANTNPLASAGFDNGGRWIWPISITDIDTKLDVSGGVYTMKAMVYPDIAFFNSEKAINLHYTPDVLTPTGDTIGAMMSDLQTKLNKSWRDRYGGDLVQFKIVLHPLEGPAAANVPASARNPAAFKIKSTTPEKNNAINLSMDSFLGTYKATIVPGTYISDIIEFAFVNSEDAQNAVLDRGNIQGQTSVSQNSPNSKNFRESIIFRVEPEIEIRGYDYSTANYIRTVTYHVQGYYTQAIVTDTVQRDAAKTAAMQYASIKAQIDNGFISKRYDYFYTGLNTEILDFDLHWNMQWNVLLPKLEGARMNYDSSAIGARPNPTNSAPQGNLIETSLTNAMKNATATQAALDSTNSQLASAATAAASLNAQLALNPPAATRTGLLNSLQATQTQTDNLLSVQQQQVNAAASAKLVVNALATSAKGAITAPKGTSYAEALVAMTSPAGGATTNTSSLAIPVSFAQFFKDGSEPAGTGFIGQFHRDKSVFGSVLGQLYTNDWNALFHIDLTIRGDPYWLGNTALERTVLLRNFKAGSTSTTSTTLSGAALSNASAAGSPASSASSAAAPAGATNSSLPKIWYGDQVILLTFRYPIRIGADFAPVFKPDDTITSLYRVKSVKHIFSEGTFKQILSADRLSLNNIIQGFGYSPPPTNGTASSGTPLASGPGMTGSTTGTMPSTAVAGKQAFIDAYTPYALAQSQATGIAPEIILAQAAQETGWGASAPGNNFFGIKGPGQVLQTTEADANGNLVPQTASFSGYASAEASFTGYGNLINSNPTYANLKTVAANGGSLADQAAALQSSGYATDPNYGSQVLAIAQNINLNKTQLPQTPGL